MGKNARARRASNAASKTSALRTSPNWPLLALSGVGMVLTGYLSFTALTGGAVQGCSAGGGCDVVLSSQWATLLGLPTSLWGFFGYTALAAIAFVRKADTHWSAAWTVALFGVCYSVYLTVVSLTMLDSTCPYCLTSLALMSSILGLVGYQRPPLLAQRSWGRLAGARVAIAAVVILMIHAGYTSSEAEVTGPEDPQIRALADHLKKEGVVFYGASWCPHCQEQKRLFGASASRLPYVECSPAGRNAPQATACTRAGVNTYPTWIINGRATVGEVMSLAQLADASGFPGALNFR